MPERIARDEGEEGAAVHLGIMCPIHTQYILSQATVDASLPGSLDEQSEGFFGEGFVVFSGLFVVQYAVGLSRWSTHRWTETASFPSCL